MIENEEYVLQTKKKHTIKFSKKLAKNTNKKIADLETKLKHFEKHGHYVDNIDYKVCKQ